MSLRKFFQSRERRKFLRQFFQRRVRLGDVSFTIRKCHLIRGLEVTYRTRDSSDRREEIDLLKGMDPLCGSVHDREREILDPNIKGEDSLHGNFYTSIVSRSTFKMS